MKLIILFVVCTVQIVSASADVSVLCINNIPSVEKRMKHDSTRVFADTLAGQLQTAKKLAQLMNAKKYEEAILLFSARQQKKIAELKKKPESFNYWCLAWTFDKAKYERYQNRIKAGNGIFVFEENEWKIDEN